MSGRDRRFLFLFVAQLAFVLFTGEANTVLAPFGVYLTLAGLLPVLPALYLGLFPATCLGLLTGFALDVFSPLPFGTNAFLLAFATLFVVQLARRYGPDSPHLAIPFALLANLILFAGRTALAPDLPWSQGWFWQRLLLDFALSQALVALATPLWLRAQESVLRWGALTLAGEERSR